MQFTTYSTSDSRMLSRLEVINRKYKVLFFAANDDVAGQASDGKVDLAGEDQDEPQHEDQSTEHHKHAAEVGHGDKSNWCA